MPVRLPEIPALFGAIDSAGAAEDGAAYSAHLLRAIAMQANRLASKGHVMCCLVWPRERNTSSEAHTQARIVQARRHWGRLRGPLPLPKKPGLTSASVRMSVDVRPTAGTPAADNRVDVQVITRATPVRQTPVGPVGGARATVAQTASGVPVAVDIDSVPLDPGAMESVEVWVRGAGGLPPLGDAATFGHPNAGTIASGQALLVIEPGGLGPFSADPGLFISEDTAAHSPPSWVLNHARQFGIETYASSGHELWMTDSAGGYVLSLIHI